MPWWTWLCLAVGGGLAIAASLVAVAAVIGLFRRLGALGRSLEPALAQLERSAGELEHRGAAAAAAQGRLLRSMAALDASVAGLRVLSWALADVRAVAAALRALVPRK